MGRRKIEIKPIKDDRNRSVTFLKRKGGLFKKAHELSVLCSVDVAVFIFGNNKKLYEYSSGDMRELITKYTYHGGPNEHKGPSDFNGGVDDEGSDEENGTPPQGEGIDPHMLPPHFQGQPQFSHMRHHTPSASPPIQNGVFAQHPGHPIPRGHTPQPGMGSRPPSRGDIRRMGPNMVQQVGPPVSQPPQVNGYAFMPQPTMYNPQNQPNMGPNVPHGAQYPYPPPQAHTHQMQPYMEDQRRSSLPPNFPPHGTQQQGPQQAPRHSVSPPQPQTQQLPQQQIPHMSPPPPQPHPMQSPPQPQHPPQPQPTQPQQPPHEHQLPQIQEPPPPPPMELKSESSVVDRARQPPMLDTVVKKLPQRKGGSIFTPIDENRSILSQHLAAFHAEPLKADGSNRPQTLEVVGSFPRSNATTSPPAAQRAADGQAHAKREGPMASIPETTFTPPSRSNSLRVGGGAARPRLKVQIPDEPSDGGSATAESGSPRGASTDGTSQPSRRPTDSHSGSGVVLPPPSPSATTLLSAGATGPPNPFARPNPHHQNNNNMNIDTPVSALPSRFMSGEFLPSPNAFYNDWNFRGSDSNTLPSPLNFTTPVVGTGPSFLREDPTPHKRKSPEVRSPHPEGAEAANEAKRIKVDS